MTQHKMIEINLLRRTTNGEQHGSDTSPEETYRAILRGTLDAVDEAQVHLSDIPLDLLTVEVDVYHYIVDKCYRLDL